MITDNSIPLRHPHARPETSKNNQYTQSTRTIQILYRVFSGPAQPSPLPTPISSTDRANRSLFWRSAGQTNHRGPMASRSRCSYARLGTSAAQPRVYEYL